MFSDLFDSVARAVKLGAGMADNDALVSKTDIHIIRKLFNKLSLCQKYSNTKFVLQYFDIKIIY